MKYSFKLFLAGIALLAMSGAVHAETGRMYVPPKLEAGAKYKGVVRDSNGNPVRDSNGSCVRTNWAADCDQCAPQPPAEAGIPLAERTVYFDFNKSKLTPEAKKKLDALVSKMRMRGPIKSVRITGYADAMGDAAYNEKLSKKRAEAVRKYLESQGVAHAMVTQTRWFGETTPATNCPKEMKRKDRIACMAPDRRVEVEVEFGIPGVIPLPPEARAPVKAKAKNAVNEKSKAAKTKEKK